MLQNSTTEIQPTTSKLPQPISTIKRCSNSPTLTRAEIDVMVKLQRLLLRLDDAATKLDSQPSKSSYKRAMDAYNHWVSGFNKYRDELSTKIVDLLHRTCRRGGLLNIDDRSRKIIFRSDPSIKSIYK